jgi:radical SAM superfamily enzyme YgiQ (UPF0313 family)
MYKGIKFAKRSLAEIRADIDEAREVFGPRETAFIADSDSLLLPYIGDAIAYLRQQMPEIRRVTSYARARTLAALGSEKLAGLKGAGLDRLHVGLESGDPETLAVMEKGARPEHFHQAADAAHQAGLELSLYVLVGGGGEGRWREHAEGTARVINRCRPEFVRLRTLVVQDDSPLKVLADRGDFASARPMTLLRETAALMAQLEVSGCLLASDHATNLLVLDGEVAFAGVNGGLPEDKERMLEILRSTIRRLTPRAEALQGPNELYAMGYHRGL